MSMNNPEPPCKLEDLVNFSFQFQNLQKYIDYLNSNDTLIFQKVKDIHLKLSEMDDLKSKLGEFELIINSNKNKFSDIEQSLSSHQAKFIDLESRLWLVASKNEDMELKMKSVSDRASSLEDNTNNLNRLMEDNIKNYYKLTENVEKMKHALEVTSDKTDTVASNVNKLTENLSESEKKIVDLNTKLDGSIENSEKRLAETNKEFEDIVENITRRISDTESTMIKVFDTVTEMTTGVAKNPRRGNQNLIATLITAQSDTASSQVMSEFTRTNKEIDELKANHKALNENIKEILKRNDELQTEINNLNEKILQPNDFSIERDDKHNSEFFSNTLNGFNKNNNNLQTIQLPLNVNNDAIGENLQKLSENIKIVSQNLGHKANREDLEKLNKHLKSELEKLIESFNDKMKSMETKLKILPVTPTAASAKRMSISTEGLGEGTGNGNFGSKIEEAVARISREIVEKEISEYNLHENEHFRNAIEKMDNYKSEIDKLFESVIEIRTSFAETKIPLEVHVKESNSKLSEIEINFKGVRRQIEEISKNIEGDPSITEEIKTDFKGGSFKDGNISLKDQVRGANMTIKTLTDKIDRIGSKLENLNTELLAKMKKDLQHESGRILEDFKIDLKSSICKIEDQLREKVDRFNLDEFGRKIDSKLNNEMNKKLDRNDLKRNNNLINRKIDTLENKISKTLVDTLIDLQMDEAPLIVKKSINGEKCASCNQFMPGGHNHHDNNSAHHEYYKQIKPGKFSFSSSYRPGETKFLSTHHPICEMNEENLKKGNSQGHGNIQGHLPEISTPKSQNELSRTSYKKKNEKMSKFNATHSPYPRDENIYDRQLGSMINEELEKKYINPMDLIKTVNRAHEINDKKNAILNNK